jgi:2-C-methyl-D-erythritol 4-phosphate cytidylyltransferase
MNVAIIVAAGQGTRIGGKRAKQFLELGGIPVIVHTLKKFENCKSIDKFIVVLQANEAAGFLALAERFSFRKLSGVVTGGPTRAQSVLRGLRAIRGVNVDIVAVHDGVRPFVTGDEIDRTVGEAALSGAAVLVAPVTDTVKVVSGNKVDRTVDRSTLRRALTPQCFKLEIIRSAFESAESLDSDISDESMLVERLGIPVSIIEGSARNIKITVPEDLAIGEYLIREDTN